MELQMTQFNIFLSARRPHWQIDCFKVVQYDSVPLKTYLPEGDIDLTVISVPDSRKLPLDIDYALLAEEQNGNDEYKLKDIRFIDAEVKQVKCVVNDDTIDISFNQLHGLFALCFLEQVDHLIGKNHLFKRSIILIKSWCYYESHIMGAMYGPLSTYALETLVLYLFRMYNASLASPLMVLYVFLKYYSKFNWDKFGISIDSAINLSLLPDIVVENPTNHALFGAQFLRELITCTPCLVRPAENRPPFMRKVVNIVDPLKTNNNLGRSINIGPVHLSKCKGSCATIAAPSAELGLWNNFWSRLVFRVLPETVQTLSPHTVMDSTPCRVPRRERRLVFGSFGRVSMNSSLPLMDEKE